MKYFVLLLILIAIICTPGCIFKTHNYYSETGSHETTCGGIAYNQSSELCCQDTVYTKQIYNDSSAYQCCGNMYYNWKNLSQSCCYGNNQDKIFDKTTQDCCKGTIYNLNTDHCCQGKIVSGTAKYSSYWQECGNQCYDYTKQGCCNKTLFDKNTQSCCYYNSNGNWSDGKIFSGKSCCCIGRPSKINETSCDPDTGYYKINRAIGSCGNENGPACQAIKREQIDQMNRVHWRI